MKQHRTWAAVTLLLMPIIGILVGICFSPAFQVREVVVRAPSASIGEEIRLQLQISPGASTVFFPLHRVIEQVRQCHRVDGIHVQRELPERLIVTVTMRPPFATLDHGDRFTIISREGVCLYRRGTPPEVLPRVRGLTREVPPLGSRIERERIEWLHDVLFGATKGGIRPGLLVDFTEPHQVRVQTQAGVEGVLGNINDLSRKTTALGRIIQQVNAEGGKLERVDLSIPEAPVIRQG